MLFAKAGRPKSGFQPFVFQGVHRKASKLAGFAMYPEHEKEVLYFVDALKKRLPQSFFQCFLNPDCRKRLGSGDVQCITVRHGW
ncbi:hypothetical protein [Polaromonas sp. OV174]|uniref:hypothetical protein n=1 Tax=Polaromonas sp. OV174 TaxID=1855300 RepID=UPI0011602B85|nr:hypothetical protein [Polaromonas sp. OV174]